MDIRLYLEKALNIEERMLTLDYKIEVAERKLLTLGKPKEFDLPKKEQLDSGLFYFYIVLILIALTFTTRFAIVAPMNRGLRFDIGENYVLYVSFFVLLVVCFLLFRFKTTAENIRISKRNKAAAKEYIRMVTEDKERVEKEQRDDIPPLTALLEQLTRERDIVREELAEFYSDGVIKPDFRGIVPVGTMLEYFTDGRCSELEGEKGAYALYVYEWKHRIIFSTAYEVMCQVKIADGLPVIRADKTQKLLLAAVKRCVDAAEY